MKLEMKGLGKLIARQPPLNFGDALYEGLHTEIFVFAHLPHVTSKMTAEQVQVNLDMTDSMGPGKLVRHMQNPSYT